MTVEGFEPLLQFAYTAKLLFTKENIVEIHNCAEILGFHNLDKACFDFLLPKFFDRGKSIPRIQRKVCCKTKCCQQKRGEANSRSLDGDEREADHADAPPAPSRAVPETGGDGTPPQSSASVSEPADACGPGCPEEHAEEDYSLLCPKYRKFQMACGKDRCCLGDCGPQGAPVPPAPTGESRVSPCLPCAGAENNDGSGDSCDGIPAETGGGPQNEAAPLASRLPCAPESSPGAGFLATADLSCGEPAGPSSAAPDCCPAGPMEDAAVALEGDEVLGCGGMESTVNFDPADSALSSLIQEVGGGRSSVEREVAEHLAKGFWPDPSPSPAETLLLDPEGQAALGKAADFHWLKHLDLNASTAECPFLRDLGEVPLPEELEAGAQPETSPCISSVNSGDNSDSDLEGDRERAREVRG